MSVYDTRGHRAYYYSYLRSLDEFSEESDIETNKFSSVTSFETDYAAKKKTSSRLKFVKIRKQTSSSEKQKSKSDKVKKF